MPTNNPAFAIEVEGKETIVGVTQLIQRVEYESADGIADVARLTAVNPDFIVSNAKVFQPGNEMSIFMGYGSDLQHVGRVIIAKNRPTYPQNAMPTIQIVGYTKDSKMMDNAPEGSKKKGGKGGRGFKDVKFSDAVRERAGDYDFETDIDDTPDAEHGFWQKPGLSDYEFVKGLSNITGFVFWVDGDDDGIWTLHFKDPEQLTEQEETFTFKYNLGDLSSLLSFQPELLIKGFQTKIAVKVKDIKTGRILEAEVEEENDDAPDVSAETEPTAELEGDHTTASDIKLFINDFSFEVTANRRFKTEAEIIAWAQQWFRRQRENFVLARGRLIGVESLRARQVHAIEGIESGLEGDYYFTKVKHIFSNSDGYVIDFGARKVMP